jgi:hypothetical protein
MDQLSAAVIRFTFIFVVKTFVSRVYMLKRVLGFRRVVKAGVYSVSKVVKRRLNFLLGAVSPHPECFVVVVILKY